MDGPKMPLSSEGESRHRHELKLVPVLSSQAPSPPFYGNPSAENRSSSPQGGCDRGFQQQRELLFFLKAHSALLFLEDTTAPCMLQPQRPLLKAHAPLSGSSTICKLLAACAFCAEKQTTVKIGVRVCVRSIWFSSFEGLLLAVEPLLLDGQWCKITRLFLCHCVHSGFCLNFKQELPFQSTVSFRPGKLKFDCILFL